MHGQATRMGLEHYQDAPEYKRAHMDRMAAIYPAKIKLLEYTLRNPPLSGSDRATQAKAFTAARMLAGAMRNANDRAMLGEPPLPADQAIIDSIKFDDVLNSLLGVQHRVEGRGFEAATGQPVPQPAPAGPQLSPLQQIFKEFNLGPIPQPFQSQRAPAAPWTGR
jgi:hypothetical protein